VSKNQTESHPQGWVRRSPTPIGAIAPIDGRKTAECIIVVLTFSTGFHAAISHVSAGLSNSREADHPGRTKVNLDALVFVNKREIHVKSSEELRGRGVCDCSKSLPFSEDSWSS
jgi:hypothetical protein